MTHWIPHWIAVIAILTKALILIFLGLSASAEPYKVNRIIDGDTIEIAVGFLPAPLPPKLSIRVLGVDTPEKAPRALCPVEAAKALEASALPYESPTLPTKRSRPASARRSVYRIDVSCVPRPL